MESEYGMISGQFFLSFKEYQSSIYEDIDIQVRQCPKNLSLLTKITKIYLI
jgi:hypothetical protein